MRAEKCSYFLVKGHPPIINPLASVVRVGVKGSVRGCVAVDAHDEVSLPNRLPRPVALL